MLKFSTIYMVILSVLAIIILLKYLFNKFRDGNLILKLLVIISNFIVLGYMYTGVQTGITYFQIRFEDIDNKEIIMENLKDVSYEAAIAGTIFFIIGQIIIRVVKHIEDKKYKNRTINSENKAWDNFYNK